MEFDELLKAARGIFKTYEPTQYAQAMVLETCKGVIYGVGFCEPRDAAYGAQERALVKRLSDAKDTQIAKLLCVWRDGGIDLPSYSFRAMLCVLNTENTNAKIFVKGEKAIFTKRLYQTMPASFFQP